jgi:branched-chain amino acid transport system substrate-binding protein
MKTRSKLRDVGLCAAVTTLALGVAGCGDTSSGSGSESGTIVIGSVHPVSGALALEGGQMDQAVQLAVDDINAAGGIESLDGRELRVVSGDSQGKPDVGQTVAQQLIQRDDAVALIGAYQSAVSLNVSTVAERYGVPLIMDIAADDAILDGDQQWTYRLQPNASTMGRDGAANLAEITDAAGDQVKTVAYLHDNTSFGEGIFDAFEEEAAALGIEVVEEIAYDPFATEEFTTQMARIASVKPDAIVATGYYADGIKIAQAAAAVAPEVKTLFGVGQAAWANLNFTSDAGKDAQLVFCSCYHENATAEATAELRERFEEEFGAPMVSEAVFAYQATMLVAEALEESGSADPAKIRDAINELSVENDLLAYTEPTTFDEHGENEAAAPVVTQVQEGQLVQVYPTDLAETTPVFPGTSWSTP